MSHRGRGLRRGGGDPRKRSRQTLMPPEASSEGVARRGDHPHFRRRWRHGRSSGCSRLDVTGHGRPGGHHRRLRVRKPTNPKRSILVMNVNPLAPTLATSFDTGAVYQINVDTDGDARTDISFRIRFSDTEGGGQEATVRRQTGEDAGGRGGGGEVIISDAPVSFGSKAVVTESDPYRFFAGIRSDPFFFDLLGFLAGFEFTGSDFFIDKNV
ncbi:MAG: DUF4331 domain-containing protein, partial [Actinobacteria bacterium]